MVKKFIDLRLYLGKVDNHGFGEGRFYEDDDYNLKRHLDAMRHVRQQIDAVVRNSRFTTLRIYDQSLFVDEIKAREFLSYCVGNISGADEFIQLLDSMHGQINFWRKVRFNGWSKSESEKLIKELRRFGYEPQDDWEVDNSRYYLDQWQGSEEIRQSLKENLEKAVKNLWFGKLEFY